MSIVEDSDLPVPETTRNAERAALKALNDYRATRRVAGRVLP